MASVPPRNFDEELKLKQEQTYSSSDEQKAFNWLKSVSGKDTGSSFKDTIRSGVILCEALLKLAPGCIPKKKFNPNPKHYLEEHGNINAYLEACDQFGVESQNLFTLRDVGEHNPDYKMVINNIFALSRAAQKKGLTWFPALGPMNYRTAEEEAALQEKKRLEKEEERRVQIEKDAQARERVKQLEIFNEEKKKLRNSDSASRAEARKSERLERRITKERSPKRREEDEKLKFGYDLKLQNDMEAKFEMKHSQTKESLMNWIEEISKEPVDDFVTHLKSGRTLCNFVNSIAEMSGKQKLIKTINKGKIKMQEVANIEKFLDVLPYFGIPREKGFEANDLYEGRNLSNVSPRNLKKKKKGGKKKKKDQVINTLTTLAEKIESDKEYHTIPKLEKPKTRQRAASYSLPFLLNSDAEKEGIPKLDLSRSDPLPRHLPPHTEVHPLHHKKPHKEKHITVSHPVQEPNDVQPEPEVTVLPPKRKKSKGKKNQTQIENQVEEIPSQVKKESPTKVNEPAKDVKATPKKVNEPAKDIKATPNKAHDPVKDVKGTPKGNEPVAPKPHTPASKLTKDSPAKQTPSKQNLQTPSKQTQNTPKQTPSKEPKQEQTPSKQTPVKQQTQTPSKQTQNTPKQTQPASSKKITQSSKSTQNQQVITKGEEKITPNEIKEDDSVISINTETKESSVQSRGFFGTLFLFFAFVCASSLILGALWFVLPIQSKEYLYQKDPTGILLSVNDPLVWSTLLIQSKERLLEFRSKGIDYWEQFNSKLKEQAETGIEAWNSFKQTKDSSKDSTILPEDKSPPPTKQSPSSTSQAKPKSDAESSTATKQDQKIKDPKPDDSHPIPPSKSKDSKPVEQMKTDSTPPETIQETVKEPQPEPEEKPVEKMKTDPVPLKETPQPQETQSKPEETTVTKTHIDEPKTDKEDIIKKTDKDIVEVPDLTHKDQVIPNSEPKEKDDLADQLTLPVEESASLVTRLFVGLKSIAFTPIQLVVDAVYFILNGLRLL